MLVQRYLDNVVAADRSMITKMFHVMKWTPAELNRAIATLLEDGTIQEMGANGTNQPQLVSTQALEQTG